MKLNRKEYIEASESDEEIRRPNAKRQRIEQAESTAAVIRGTTSSYLPPELQMTAETLKQLENMKKMLMK